MAHPQRIIVIAMAWLFALAGAALAQSTDESGCCEVVLPDPFRGIDEAVLIRALYPAYDPRTRLLGADVVGEEGQALGGNLYAAVLEKGTAEPVLLVLIETWAPMEDGTRPDFGAAGYGLDLAAFTLADGAPVLLAQAKNASGHSGHSAVDFDLAAYRVDAARRAFGLRSTYMHMGALNERLVLFLREGSGFAPIFERDMLESNQDMTGDELAGPLDAAAMAELYEFFPEQLAFRAQAVLQVQPGKAGAPNLFKVVERRVERRDDGGLDKRTLTEFWRWDETAGTYVKRP